MATGTALSEHVHRHNYTSLMLGVLSKVTGRQKYYLMMERSTPSNYVAAASTPSAQCVLAAWIF